MVFGIEEIARVSFIHGFRSAGCLGRWQHVDGDATSDRDTAEWIRFEGSNDGLGMMELKAGLMFS